MFVEVDLGHDLKKLSGAIPPGNRNKSNLPAQP